MDNMLIFLMQCNTNRFLWRYNNTFYHFRQKKKQDIKEKKIAKILFLFSENSNITNITDCDTHSFNGFSCTLRKHTIINSTKERRTITNTKLCKSTTNTDASGYRFQVVTLQQNQKYTGRPFLETQPDPNATLNNCKNPNTQTL